MRTEKVSAKTVDELKNEVYRQMFRLEAERPAARVLLAVALLNAWASLEQQPPDCESRQWLRKLSPVCLRMIAAGCRGKCCDGDGEDRPIAAKPAPVSRRVR
jgi:hypothetical protein